MDADDTKVVDDVDGAASAKDERAVAGASNKAEQSEKAEKSEGGPEKLDEQSGKPVLGAGQGPSPSETTPGTNLAEGRGVGAGDTGNQTFYVDVAPPCLPRSPAFDDNHVEEWPPPIREWSGRLRRRNMT